MIIMVGGTEEDAAPVMSVGIVRRGDDRPYRGRKQSITRQLVFLPL